MGGKKKNLSLRTKLRAIGIGVGMTTIFLGLGELYLRSNGYSPRNIYKPGYIIFTSLPDKREWGLNSNLSNAPWCTATEEGRPPYTFITTNSKGLRESHEIPDEKPEKEIRIFLIGDSVAMGLGVYEEETFCEQLEDIIEANPNKNKFYQRAEVINGAICSYCPVQEFYMLKNVGIGYNPDIVIQQVCENDPRNEGDRAQDEVIGGWSIMEAKSNLPQIYDMPSFERRIREFLIEHSSVARKSYETLLNIHASLRNKARAKINRESYDNLFDRYTEQLQRTYDLARSHSKEYLLVIFPHTQELKTSKSSDFAERTIRYMKENGIPYLDLLPEIISLAVEKGIAPETLVINPKDPLDSHLTSIGNKIVAQIIFDYLEKEKLI